jgi:ribosomal protein L11 methyltransferase
MRALIVDVASEHEDWASFLLWEAGSVGIEVRPAPGDPGSVSLLAYFDDAPPGRERLRGLPPGARVQAVPVPEVDWVARFREGFRSFRVGPFLLVPVWEGLSPASDVLVVDPGRAFGTGTHETTRLCLRALVDVSGRSHPARCLDLGSGAGLLAVAATRLGCPCVVASDLDPEATASTRHHARLNAAGVHVVRADGGAAFRAATFDLVLANLTAPLLQERAAEIARLRAPTGALVLSGLLVPDVQGVADAFSVLGRPAVDTEGEWAALLFEAGPR